MPILAPASDVDTFAAAALNDQLTRPGSSFGVSLDGLWRAVGSPAGESPEDWLRLAAPLLDAVNSYRKQVEAAHGRDAIKRPGVWTVTKRLAAVIAATLSGDDLLVFELGDIVTCETIGTIYADFLDQRGPRRPFTSAGILRRGAFLEMVADLPQFNCPDPLPADVVANMPTALAV